MDQAPIGDCVPWSVVFQFEECVDSTAGYAGGVAMNEVDDRLVGDPVWELFPYSTPGPDQEARRAHKRLRWLAVAGLVAIEWLLYPPLAVVTACLAVAAPDFRPGRLLARSIPDKAGGTICPVDLCVRAPGNLGWPPSC